MQVTVVGAGVIGLTVAAELTRAGHAVEVVAERVLDDTTSAVAGAVWFPYRAGPPDRVARWAARSRERLLAVIADPAAGVDQLTGYECADGDAEAVPWWARAAMDHSVSAAARTPNPHGEGPQAGARAAMDHSVSAAARTPNPHGEGPQAGAAATVGVERVPAPVTGAPPAWRFATPRIEPARFLPWLTAQLARPVRIERVTALDRIGGDAVIDCAGLGARALARDPSVTALRGQVVVVEPGTIPLELTLTDDRGAEPIFYAIPRRDEVVLGGSSDPAEPDDPLAPDPAVTERILARCRALGWQPGAVRRVRVGLRPCRPAVRLERDPDQPRVIHCYGHGGAGYTLAFGCAEEVAALL